MRALVVYALLVTSACTSAAAAAPAPVPFVVQAPAPVLVEASEGTVTLDVLELLCHTCASQILLDSRGIFGVSSAQADLATRLLTLRYDPTKTSEARVVAAVEDIVDRVAR